MFCKKSFIAKYEFLTVEKAVEIKIVFLVPKSVKKHIF